MHSQPLDIRYQVQTGVVLHTTAWQAAATATLVKQNDAVASQIKHLPMPRRAAAARAAMQKHNRQTTRLAALLKVDLMTVAHVQHARGVGLSVMLG